MKEESKLNLYLKKLWIAVCLTLILKKINYWHRKQSIEYLKKFWSKQTKIKTFLFCYKPLNLLSSWTILIVACYIFFIRQCCDHQAVREPGERPSERRHLRHHDRGDALPDELLDRRVETDQEVSEAGRRRHFYKSWKIKKNNGFLKVGVFED